MKDTEDIVCVYRERIVNYLANKEFSTAKRLIEVLALMLFSRDRESARFENFLLWIESFYIEGRYEGKNQDEDEQAFLQLIDRMEKEYSFSSDWKALLLAKGLANKSMHLPYEEYRDKALNECDNPNDPTDVRAYYDKMKIICYFSEPDQREQLERLFEDATLFGIAEEDYEKVWLSDMADIISKKYIPKRPCYLMNRTLDYGLQHVL